MSKFFTADNHFGHANSLGFLYRPFSSVTDMDTKMIEAWNKAITSKDEVYMLGDFSFGGQGYTLNILNQLNGKLFFIKGNHDRYSKRPWFQDRMEWVKDYYELKVHDPDAENGKSQKIVLSHYPLMVWNNAHHGAWHFHGHCHGSLRETIQTTRIDVGADVFGFVPQSYETLKTTMMQRMYHPIDHHQETK